MKRIQIVAAILSAASVIVMQGDVASATQTAEDEKSLEELLKEKRDTLQTIVNATTKRFQQGTVPIESVIRATDQLARAEFDLAGTPNARITILQQRVTSMKSLYSIMSAKLKNGDASPMRLLEAKAALLDARIELARERKSQAKQKDE